jgi:hypothetical protein
MTKNPFINALIAIAYIAVVASFMYYGGRTIGPVSGLIMPVAMLSLFVLSAAFMGLVFFYHPVQMYFDGDKKGSLSLLTKTVAVFAGVTVLLIIALFLSAPKL